MSLMRLLAVGESLMGIRNSRSPYRIARDHWLPDFSMEKEQAPTDQAQASGRGTGPAVSELKSRGRVGRMLEGRLRQGELALEQVRVMRNDLSDSDVEVTWQRAQPSLFARPAVSSSPQPAAPAAKALSATPVAKASSIPASPVSAAHPAMERGGAGWGVLMRRVFRADPSPSLRP